MNDSYYPSIRDAGSKKEIEIYANTLLDFYNNLAAREIRICEEYTDKLMDKLIHGQWATNKIRDIQDDYIWNYYENTKLIQSIGERVWSSLSISTTPYSYSKNL